MLWDSSSPPPLPVITSKELDGMDYGRLLLKFGEQGYLGQSLCRDFRCQCVQTKADTGPLMDKSHREECFLSFFRRATYCTPCILPSAPRATLPQPVFRVERPNSGSTDL